MSIYLFVLCTSFIINLIFIIPFINLLYKLKFQRGKQETKDAFDKRTPIFDSFHKAKVGTPVGGGLMLVVTTLILFLLFSFIFTALKVPVISNFGQVINEIKIILFTFVFFSFLGLYDDISKILFLQKGSFFGLRLRHKLFIEIALALVVSFWIFKDLKVDFINIPFFGIMHLGWFYILFAAFVIVAFANAVNITDGLDGLASGSLAVGSDQTAFFVVYRFGYIFLL